MTSQDTASEEAHGERTRGTRRDVMKGVAIASAGALGSLAGCTGQEDGEGGDGDGGDGGDGETTPTETMGDGGDETDTATQTEAQDGGGGSEQLTIEFMTPDMTESSAHETFYKDKMEQFEGKQGNVTVDLQGMGWGTLWEKLPAMAQSGDLPDVAMSGAVGLQLDLEQDVLIDHTAYIEEAEDLPDKLHPAHQETMNYRGEWWTAGSHYTQATMLGIRPRFFKEVGVSDPSEIATWSGFRQAVDAIDQEFSDVVAYEETGVAGDLESYWGEARTAYSGGDEPWIDVTDKGSHEDPHVKVGQNGRTDGMILNCLDMGLTYSSQEVATRADEGVPPLMVTDRVASYPHHLGRIGPFTSAKSDVTFGWDGDIYVAPLPRLDEQYGDEFGIPELAGKSGEHGGNAWGFDIMHVGFNSTSSPDAAWNLMDYICRDPDFVVPYLGEVQTTAPGHSDLLEPLRDNYDLPQPQEQLMTLMSEWGPQYAPAGANWDLPATDPLRKVDLAETITETFAGQHEVAETPDLIRERMLERLSGG